MQNIDFRSIRPHNGSLDGGFEELVAQLARLEPRDGDIAFFRKGSGGDAGVECFAIEATGRETGWQAKYIFEWNTGLGPQLDASIATALAKHPELEHYVVCLPFDLSDARREGQDTALQKWIAWRDKWIARTAPRILQISLWDKSAFTERLSRPDPAYRGRLLFWFDKESLTPDYFQARFAISSAALGERYSRDVNVELPIRDALLGFVRAKGVPAELDASTGTIMRDLRHLKRACTDLNAPDIAQQIAEEIWSLVKDIGAFNWRAPTPFPSAQWLERLSGLQRALHAIVDQIFARPDTPKSSAHGDVRREAINRAYGLLGSLEALADKLQAPPWTAWNASAVLLSGEAGIGKSHLLADVVQHQILQQAPALLVLGSGFVDAAPWPQLLQHVDFAPSRSTSEFLAALDAAGEAAGARALICVDALNERHGLDVWPSRLAAFLAEAQTYSWVCIAVSCRTTYLPAIAPESLRLDGLMRLEHPGFGGTQGEAARRYLAFRKIVRPGVPSPLPEMDNPLFLRTLCDSLQRQGKTALPRGLNGVSAIFSHYIAVAAEAVDGRMRFSSLKKVTRAALDALTEAIAKGDRGYITLADATAITEAVSPSHNLEQRDLLVQLLNEGVLTTELVSDEAGGEVTLVRFTFERMSDHLIAARLLDLHLSQEDPASSFATGSPLHEFAFGAASWKNAGILEAMAIQLPERCSLEFLDVTPPEEIDWHRDAFHQSLLWRDQSRFTQNTLDWVEKVAEDNGETYKTLIAIATEPNNPFNAAYLFDQLNALSLPERDARWSAPLAMLGFEGPVQTLADWALEDAFDDIESERAALAGIALALLLSSPNRQIRDRATQALAALLAPRLDQAPPLLQRFSTFDDPFVLERLVAAIYGAALQGMSKTALPALTAQIHAQIFARDEPPPCALLRDHAAGLLEFAAARGALDSNISLARTRPPFATKWFAEPVFEEELAAYKQSYGGGNVFDDRITASALKDGDFARYQIDSIAHQWSPAPIDGPPARMRQRFDAWLGRFQAEASDAQTQAYADMTLAAKPARDQGSFAQTPERAALESATKTFRALLTPHQWEDYRSQAKNFVEAFLHDDKADPQWVVSADIIWARRWVCRRAHQYGWTPERFAQIDDALSREHDGRRDHRIERIGKKYQWMALSELAARLGDTAYFLERRNGADTGERYHGAYQIGLRNMDPSLLVKTPPRTGRGNLSPTWWTPATLTLPYRDILQRLAWRASSLDMPIQATQIELTDPKTRKNYLALNGFQSWSQYADGAKGRVLQQEVWRRLFSIAVRSGDLDALLQHLKGEQLTDPHYAPHIDLGYAHLGEYPWHRAFAETDTWIEPTAWGKYPVPIKPTIATYQMSDSEYDHSLKNAGELTLPAPWIVSALDLGALGGRDFGYENKASGARFWDPSSANDGASCGLVSRDHFLNALQAQDLAVVWVVAGEKRVMGGQEYRQGYGGAQAFSALHYLKDGVMQTQASFVTNAPSPRQLRDMFDEEGAPKDAARIESLVSTYANSGKRFLDDED